jgi:toxin ParE1/3/4
VKPAKYHPLAQSELIDSALYYENRHTGLGDRFLTAVDNSLKLVREHPGLGAPSDRGARILRVKKFPFGIVYKEYDEHIFVVAIAHFSRKPGFWHRRM